MRKIPILVSALLMIFLSCKKSPSSSCPVFNGYLLPYTLYFVLKINGQRLADSTLNNLRLYYVSNGAKNYVYDFGRAGSDGYNLGAMLTRDVGYKSGDNNIKDYYLEFYPGGDVDTLFVDYKRYSICEADTSACYCLYPRLSIKYNGQTASYDPSITQQQVYLFNKK